MNEGLISSRYAKMLFDLSSDKNVVDPVRNDFEYIYSLIRDIKELDKYLENPVVRPAQKLEMFHILFAGVQPVTFSFLELLLKNNREGILGHIAHRFIQEYKERKGIQQGSLVTSVAISDDMRKKILEQMDKVFKCKIELQCEVDERLIGGFVFRLEDQQFDASIATKLHSLHRNLLNTQVKKK
jgi:F-type H+-transporting ATPase subunit delta